MVKVSWRQPGARWRREGESERKRTKRAREKDERAVTKWEEIRQKEASAEVWYRARKRSRGCIVLLRKRYPFMHGTFNSILRHGGSREAILNVLTTYT